MSLDSEIQSYLERLFPLHRSITGKANRETLQILQEIIPLRRIEIPSGEKVFDWTIPPEWEIRNAWIRNARNEILLDLKQSNLHVVSYSHPIRGRFSFRELRSHLHFLPELPDAIPYRTSYYREAWGFCLSFRDFQALFREDETYEVCIDSRLEPGALSCGEFLVPGKSDQEILLSTYFCHPSLANDNLSGVLLTAFLARILATSPHYHSFRIIFVPETIGAIAYCARNEEALKRIKAGMVITCVGGPGAFGFKASFQEAHPVNRIVEQVFHRRGLDFIRYPFDIHGSDERQYSSQGFRINMVSITKDKYYAYPFYHTSLDNLNFVTAENIRATLEITLETVELLDQNLVYRNLQPCCEVMLSKHGLYPELGGGQLPDPGQLGDLDLILWILFLCDGTRDLLEISERLRTPISRLAVIARNLVQKGILECLRSTT